MSRFLRVGAMAPRRAAVVCAGLALAAAMPSFREKIPNAYEVECPAHGGWEGCTSDGLCMGLGHATCAGGGAPFSPFGLKFLAHGYEWSEAMCEDDADGDGQSNGFEVGDPCCLWAPHAVLPAEYAALMAGWHKTHPGDPLATSRSDALGLCEVYGPEDVAFEASGFFTADEVARGANHSVELVIDAYALSTRRTIYTDFIWDLPPEDAARCAEGCYLVGMEAIIDQAAHVHHYILNGCKDAWAENRDDYTPGMVRSEGFSVGCKWQLGGWAPGKDPFYELPLVASREVTGLTGFSMQVHYDNINNIAGVVDSSGFRVHYTTEPREFVVGSLKVLRLSVDFRMLIPPNRKRWFLTRTCHVNGATDDVHVHSVNFHAHLLGTEMYAELWRDGKRTAIHNDNAWFFDDQYDKNVDDAQLVLKNGDVLQATCVMDASGQTSATRFGIETTDEMCWVTMAYYPLQATLGCYGESWTGTLEPGEPAEVIPVTHPHEYTCKDYDITSEENQYSCADLAAMLELYGPDYDFCRTHFCTGCYAGGLCDESCGFCVPFQDFADEFVTCDADELAILELDDAAAVDAINAACYPHADETPVAECEWLILHVQKCAAVDGHPQISDALGAKLDNLNGVVDAIRAAAVGVHHLYGEDAPIVSRAEAAAPALVAPLLGALLSFVL